MIKEKDRIIRLAQVMAETDQTFMLVFYASPTDSLTPQQRFEIQLKGDMGEDSKISVDVEFDGPDNLLQVVNEKFGYDIIAKIKEMANKISPTECIDDYDYLEATGIKDIANMGGVDGSKILQVVPSGYKVINKYIFNNPKFYPVEEVAFLEIQFKV